MGKAGRKRKPGRRTKAGRLSRAGAPRYDKGTDHAQAMQALYGQDGCDAIGRAFRSGLLGEGSEAKALLDTARNLSNAYWSAYQTGGFVSPLAGHIPASGNIAHLDHERIKRREVWVRDSMAFVRDLGPEVDRAFRQIVIDVNPDHGPLWLDRLCYASRTRHVEAEQSDERALRAALDALEALAGIG